jgi:hypothetical protein
LVRKKNNADIRYINGIEVLEMRYTNSTNKIAHKILSSQEGKN